MKTGLKLALVIGFGITLPLAAAAAEDKVASTNPPAAPPKLSPQEQKEQWSYAIGMNIGTSMKRGAVDLDADVMATAMKDVLAGRTPKLTEQQAQEAWRSYQMESRAKQEEARKQQAEKNKKDGEAFLAENKKKPGVKTHAVTLPDGTKAEMQYKVITDGTGAIPGTNDTVSLNFKGTLISGKEVDNSAKRGPGPAKLPLNRGMRGWSEALQMMKAGAKWELYLPSSLAYGDQGFGPNIEPGSTLIYEMELVSTETPPPPAPPPPLTSDIIRVPSADELKKGAKIEVIKPEDLHKYTNAAAQKQTEEKK